MSADYLLSYLTLFLVTAQGIHCRREHLYGMSKLHLSPEVPPRPAPLPWFPGPRPEQTGDKGRGSRGEGMARVLSSSGPTARAWRSRTSRRGRLLTLQSRDTRTQSTGLAWRTLLRPPTELIHGFVSRARDCLQIAHAQRHRPLRGAACAGPLGADGWSGGSCTARGLLAPRRQAPICPDRVLGSLHPMNLIGPTLGCKEMCIIL